MAKLKRFLEIMSEEEWNEKANQAVTKKSKQDFVIPERKQFELAERKIFISAIPIPVVCKRLSDIIESAKLKPINVIPEEKHTNTKEIIFEELTRELKLEAFTQEYKLEVQENYLLKQICNAFSKIDATQKFNAKQLEAFQWARDQLHEYPDTMKEFDFEITKIDARSNYDHFEYLLRHLNKDQLLRVNQILETQI